MKHSRFTKLKSTAHDAVDLVLEQNRNPLKQQVEIKQPSHALTKTFLQDFRTPVDLTTGQSKPYVVANALPCS